MNFGMELEMNVLVINCGSSSLKYQLINMDNEKVIAKKKLLRREHMKE